MAAVREVPDVPRVPWEAFLKSFRWKPGEHILIYGTTGRGKTTLAGYLLPLRKYVVALDFKGDDPGLLRWGWPSSPQWPIPNERRLLTPRVEQRRGRRVAVVDPIRVRLAPPVITREDRGLAAEVFESCLEDVLRVGRWCVYVDELLLAVDRREYDLEDPIRRILVSGRSRGASIVNSTQSLRGIPARAYDQPTHFIMIPPRDWYGIERLEEVTGLGRGLRPLLGGLGKHDFLYASGDKYLISRAPKPSDPVPQPMEQAPPPPPTTDEPPNRGAGKVKRALWG